MGKRLESAQRAFDELNGPRRRQLERPLRQLDELRLQRNLPVDGELFAAIDPDDVADDDAETPPGGTIRMLGA